MRQTKELLRDLLDLLRLRASDPDVQREVDFNEQDFKNFGISREDFYSLLRILELQGIIEKGGIKINDWEEYEHTDLVEIWPGPYTVTASRQLITSNEFGLFNEEIGLLSIGREKVLISKGNQYSLALAIFSDKNMVWDSNELIERLTGILPDSGNKYSMKYQKMLYSAIREINKKVKESAGINKLIIIRDKTVLINPEHLSLF